MKKKMARPTSFKGVLIPVALLALVLSAGYILYTVSYGKSTYTGRNHAFLIGAGNYNSWNDLESPARDADAVAKVLRERYDFNDQDITLLTDDSREKPTQSNIIKHFGRLIDTLTADDNLLIFFAGHSFKNEKGETYWIPTDGGKKNKLKWIKHSDLCLNFFNSPNLKTKNLL